MKKLWIGLTCLAASCAWAGDPVAGEQKARSCAGCHGIQGISTAAIYPNLAGQKALYTINALKAYRSQERQGGSAALMWGIAQRLSDEDIEDLAAYYASLEPGS
ncbi:MAG: c-type cytochrome [Saccharospirillum sp.]